MSGNESSGLSDPRIIGTLPSIDSPPPEPIKQNLGDWGVAEQRGAATYTYPIQVPPGRKNLAPKLALRYSSQAPLRGGLAVGWTLDIGAIQLDLPLNFGTPLYRVNLAGRSGRLIPVVDKSITGGDTYRLEWDESFIRFERIQDDDVRWVAFSTDGMKHYFKDVSNSAGPSIAWQLVRQVDPFGNEVSYEWNAGESLGNYTTEPTIKRIRYTANANAGLEPHASVEFTYILNAESQLPAGSSLTNHGKTVVHGAHLLTGILVRVRDNPDAPWRSVRHIELTYEGKPDTVHPAATLRYLTRLVTTVWSTEGIETTAPPITFDYHRADTGFLGLNLRLETGSPFRGSLHGAHSTLMDLNGDGVKDWVTAEVGKDGYCYLVWRQGCYGGGFDETKQIWELPTANWLDGEKPSLYQEVCTLNGQVVYREGVEGRRMGLVSYHFMDITGNGRPDLITSIMALKDQHADYIPAFKPTDFSAPDPSSEELDEQTQLDREHRTGTPSPRASGIPSSALSQSGESEIQKDAETAEFRVGPGWDQRPEPGSAAPSPPGSGPSPLPVAEKKETGCYVWRIYENTGNGFAHKPMKVLTPRASNIKHPPVLSPTTSYEQLDKSDLPSASYPILLDINGNGFLDFIDTGTHPLVLEGELDDVPHWRVYSGPLVKTETGEWKFGNGKDEYDTWLVPGIKLDWDEGRPYKSPNGEEPINHRQNDTIGGLHDINGDGLPDLVVLHKKTSKETFETPDAIKQESVLKHESGSKRDSDTNTGYVLKAYLNNGKGFDSNHIDLGLEDCPLEQTQVDYTRIRGEAISEGCHGYRRRLVDVDGDGLVDIVVLPGDMNDITDTGVPTVHINTGDHFLAAETLPDIWQKSKRLFRAYAGAWVLGNDFTDVTGDGLSDLVEWTRGVTAPDPVPNQGPTWGAASPDTFLPTDTYTEAPRALAVVDNGRGMRVSFSYAPSTNRHIVSWNGKPRGEVCLPRPTWVVRSVTINAGFDTPEMVTRYHYGSPIYQPPRSGEPSRFAGFESVTVLSGSTVDCPTGKQIRREYAYDDRGEPNGRVICQETSLADYDTSSGEVATTLQQRQTTDWVRRSVFTEGSLFFCHKEQMITETFGANGEDIVGIQRITETWNPVGAPRNLGNIKPGGQTVLPPDPGHVGVPVLYVKAAIQKGQGLTEDVCDLLTTFGYQIRYGQTPYQNDDYRVLKTATHTAEAHYYDLGLRFRTNGKTETLLEEATGLPYLTKKWMGVGPQAIAQTRRWFDDQTGQVIKMLRPNHVDDPTIAIQYIYEPDFKLFVYETVNELGHCVLKRYDVATGQVLERLGPNQDQGVWEGESWAYDGFGRLLEHHISIDGPESGYMLRQIEDITYSDFVLPNRIHTRQLIDFVHEEEDTGWTETYKEVDGLGRLLIEVDLLASPPTGLPGAVTQYTYDELGNVVTIAVPDPTDDNNLVEYRYQHDGLGRVVRFTAPLEPYLSVTYDGLVEVRQQITSDGSGSTTKYVNDVFGRLIQVHEINPDDGDAVTTYQYDSLDRMVQVTDAEPEANITSFRHDWAGNRTQIQRGARRVWRYQYDLHGNMIAKVTPVPQGEPDVAYTTRIQYDALDRPVTKRPARLDLAVNVLRQLHIGPILYNYDQGRNGLGRLTQVKLPFATIAYSYDARGLLAEETRSIDIENPVTLTVKQSVKRRYNALALPTSVTWDDGQQWKTTYDERGLAHSVEWLDPNTQIWKAVAAYERTVAGQPLHRNSDFEQKRTYTYDQLGRPIGDQVLNLKTSNPTVVSTRSYDFTGGGNLMSVGGHTDGMSADAVYTYDTQHRVCSASGPGSYQGEFSYSPTGNVRTVLIDWPDAPYGRSVRYEYGDGFPYDPHAVTRLVNESDGTTYAEFAYDLAGNMISKQLHLPRQDWEIVWDSEGQLRIAQLDDETREIYFYDHGNQRLLAVEPDGVIRFWFGERETHFAASGDEVRRYLHLGHAGSSLARVERGERVELQYADIMRNLGVSIDKSGEIVANFVYGAFGETVQSIGAQDHRRQFNGKEDDACTGLKYYGYRYYDPTLLRWISADPLFHFAPDTFVTQPQKLNLYSISNNNCLRYFDPDGRDWLDNLVENAAVMAPSGEFVGRQSHMSTTQKAIVAVEGLVLGTAPITGPPTVSAVSSFASTPYGASFVSRSMTTAAHAAGASPATTIPIMSKFSASKPLPYALAGAASVAANQLLNWGIDKIAQAYTSKPSTPTIESSKAEQVDTKKDEESSTGFVILPPYGSRNTGDDTKEKESTSEDDTEWECFNGFCVASVKPKE